ncbi:MAG TPA: pyruvate kinase [Nitrospiraceae bacterium]|nr:pyruvate kinase [Nitrospiraceae bacterium]
MRKAKIVCTIGPASDAPAMLDRLIEGGMDAARLNFSHGTHESHGRAIKAIREAAGRRRVSVAIMQDLQGPRIRVGELPSGGLDLDPGRIVRLFPTDATPPPALSGTTDAVQIPVTYSHLNNDIKRGARVLIDDGLIELKVDRVSEQAVECHVVTGGHVTTHKGINLPGTAISSPTITDKDRDDLRFGIAQGVDYVALSFVRGPDDVAAAKELIRHFGGDVPVIAKIERREAVDCMESLLEQADGIMIARGDLGVEMGPEAVPILQKRLISEAKRRRCVVITATQMLESMTHNPRPTRAEASDVANAIFDGTDAVMLSAETAMGQYPMEVVRVMDRIVRAAEAGKEPGVIRRAEPGRNVTFTEATCAAASSAAAAIQARAIVVFSESGPTARLLSKQRPAAPIIAFTPCEPVRQRMNLYWGVIPHTMPLIIETDKRISEVERRLKGEGLVEKGQRIVIVSGALPGRTGGTNLMKLHEVG